MWENRQHVSLPGDSLHLSLPHTSLLGRMLIHASRKGKGKCRSQYGVGQRHRTQRITGALCLHDETQADPCLCMNHGSQHGSWQGGMEQQSTPSSLCFTWKHSTLGIPKLLHHPISPCWNLHLPQYQASISSMGSARTHHRSQLGDMGPHNSWHGGLESPRLPASMLGPAQAYLLTEMGSWRSWGGSLSGEPQFFSLAERHWETSS